MQTAAIILTHIPVWVWAILAFLVLMGLRLSRERRMSRLRLMLVPAIFLAYGAWGIENTFGFAATPILAWGAGLLTSLTLVRWSGWPGRARVEGGQYVLPGSWIPMGLMLAIFVGKFILGMGLAMNPALALQTDVAIGFSSLFGALSGAFLGRTLNILGLGRTNAQAAFA